MTESEWQTKTQLVAMIQHVRRAGCSDRKLHLTALECCRQLRHMPYPPEWREAITLFENWVEGAATAAQVIAAGARLDVIFVPTPGVIDRTELLDFEQFYGYRAAFFLTRLVPQPREVDLGLLEVKESLWNANMVHGAGQQTKVRAAQCVVVRDIFGNPFRPVAFDPVWRTSTAVALAEAIYADRAFDRLPILADALEDAGCAAADLLAHCRGDGPHVRGCWAVDLVLGKA